jgi:hypothetical protein
VRDISKHNLVPSISVRFLIHQKQKNSRS